MMSEVPVSPIPGLDSGTTQLGPSYRYDWLEQLIESWIIDEWLMKKRNLAKSVKNKHGCVDSVNLSTAQCCKH